MAIAAATNRGIISPKKETKPFSKPSWVKKESRVEPRTESSSQHVMIIYNFDMLRRVFFINYRHSRVGGNPEN